MGLRIKLIMPVLLTGVLSILFIHFYWAPSYLTDLTGKLIEIEKNELKTLSYVIAKDLADDGNLSYEGESYLSYLPEISYKLINSDGQLVNQGGGDIRGKESSTIEVRQAVIYENETLAELYAYIDISTQQQSLNQLVWIATAAILILVIALLLLQHFVLVKPLVNLRRSIDQFASGEHELDEISMGDNDIFSLRKAFMLMRSALLQSREELESEHQQVIASMEALNDNQHKFQTLFENLPDGVMIVNQDGEIVVANSELLRMTDFTMDSLYGQHFDLLLPDCHSLIENWKRGKVLQNENVNVVDNHGLEQSAELSVSQYQQENREYYVFVLRDNSDRCIRDELVHNSEEKLRTIIENASNIICSMSLKYEFTFLSPAWSEILGYSISDALGQTLLDFVDEDREMLEESIKTCSSDLFPRVEFRVKCKDGTLRWLSSSGKLVRDSQGIGLFYVVVLADITDRKVAMQALSDSEESLREAQKIGQIGNWSYNFDTDEIHWSEQVYIIFGKDKESFSPDIVNLLDAVHPEDRQLVESSYNNIKVDGEKQSYDFRVVLSNGKIHWIHAEVVADIPNDKTSKRLRGTFQDVTEIKLSEQQIKSAENRVRMILESAVEGIFGLDIQGRATFVNSSAAEMLGYLPDEIVGESIHSLIHHTREDGEPYNLLDCPFNKAIASGESQKNKREVLWRKDGRYFPIEYSVMPIRSEKVMLGAVVTFRDISESIKADEERRLLQTQLQQAQKMDAIGQLTGGIAHDFNNMLASILGYSELAMRNEVVKNDIKLIHFIEEIHKAGERGRSLIDKMLAFSRGIDSSTPEPVLLEPMLNDVLKMLRSVIPSSIVIDADIEENVPPVLVDTINLQQIIMNLCINARDAMEGKGHLKISIHKHLSHDQSCDSCHEAFSGEFIELNIADNGCGIEQENINRMFDPFFTTKEVGKGTGMGLSVVHGVVHSAGGHISVKSKVGEGTSISIYLLPTESHVIESEEAQAAEIEESHSGNILIVDDEPSVGAFLKELLQLSGYECDYVESPVAAIDLVKNRVGHYQLVISDVTMPEMTGIELAEHLRELDHGLPIILCSGYSDKLTSDVIDRLGILSVLNKPLNSMDLMDAVSEAMQEKGRLSA